MGAVCARSGLHYLLELALLVFGVGLKFVFEAELGKEELPTSTARCEGVAAGQLLAERIAPAAPAAPPHEEPAVMSVEEAWVLFGSMAVAVLAIFTLRVVHFFGRGVDVGPTDGPAVRVLVRLWWGCCLTLYPLLPIIVGVPLIDAEAKGVDPLAAVVATAVAVAVEFLSETGIIAILRTLKWSMLPLLEGEEEEEAANVVPIVAAREAMLPAADTR